MIGMLCAALPDRPDIKLIADYFSIDPNRLINVMDWMQRQEQPELMLLQNPNPTAKVRAVVFMTSAHSYSYWKSGSPSHTHIWRDFYYQCLFCGMDLLAEVGCTRLRIENPAFPHVWSRDGLACLFEAHNNIYNNIFGYGPEIEISVIQHAFTQDAFRKLKLKQTSFTEDHRPIGISDHIHEGLNMRTIFVEKKEIALRMAGKLPSMQ